MLDRKGRSQHALFIPGSLVDYIPQNHILKRVDKVLDLSWLRIIPEREEIEHTWKCYNGKTTTR